MANTNPSHKKEIVTAGKDIKEAGRVLIMVHGRGATAESILSLSDLLQVKDFALVAPQATNNTWYPYSFMAVPAQNEPWLSSALSLLKEIVNDLNKQGIPSKNIYFLGFSQGASLSLEFVTRNATRYGGIVAFTGGLIGDRIYPENYSGDFEGTPVFIGTSDPDPHVPVVRVNATANILKDMHAIVTKKVYPFMGHTINQDEIELANKLILNPAADPIPE
ncbi:MAG: alpha/beta hydrolase [Chitinophagales bacterium]